MNKDLILRTAMKVRRWAEAVAEGSYMEGDLNGMCAKASAELWRQLNILGITAQICVWICHEDKESTHVFLTVEDHVLDVTATQFRALRKVRVYFEHEKEAECHRFYRVDHCFDTDEELVNWQIDVGFVEDQIAELEEA